MDFRNNLLIFVLLGAQRQTITTTTADGETINIAIFFNVSDLYLRRIVQNAEDRFFVNQQQNSRRNEKLTFSVKPSWFDSANISESRIGLDSSLSDIRNISSNVKGAIFVDINRDTLYLASFLERSGIPTIGIFQSSEQPRTQVGLGKAK